MVVYYHGTDLESSFNILKNGLDPSLSLSFDDERAHFPKSRAGHHFVYLSYSIETARSFTPGSSGIIFAIRPPRFLSRKFNFRRGEFVRSPVKIPPQYIKIYQVWT